MKEPRRYEADGIVVSHDASRCTVTVVPNGPLHVRGELEIETPDGVFARHPRGALSLRPLRPEALL